MCRVPELFNAMESRFSLSFMLYAWALFSFRVQHVASIVLYT